MSKFIGIKVVDAVPMTAGQAAQKGYRTPAAEKYSDLESAGVEVTYEDGYKSWCPDDVFYNNNVRVIEENLTDTFHCGNPDIEHYLRRMIDEHNELVDKFIKLKTFLTSDKFKELNPGKQRQLTLQATIMSAYIAILQERIEEDIPQGCGN